MLFRSRVFCNFSNGLETMVWTNNEGRMMGYVAGPIHGDVWTWWVGVHHDLNIGPMNMNMPTPSASGGGTSPAMSPSPSMSGMPASPSASMSSMGG